MIDFVNKDIQPLANEALISILCVPAAKTGVIEVPVPAAIPSIFQLYVTPVELLDAVKVVGLVTHVLLAVISKSNGIGLAVAFTVSLDVQPPRREVNT